MLSLSLSRNLFDDLFSIHSELGNFFEQTSNPSSRSVPSLPTRQGGFKPEVEAYSKNGNLVYRLAIPGVDAKNIDLSIVGGQLVVRGERTAPSELKDENWYARQFRYGHFERAFSLPEHVDVDKVNATFSNGILEITVPTAKAQLPKKIEIKQQDSVEQPSQLKATA